MNSNNVFKMPKIMPKHGGFPPFLSKKTRDISGHSRSDIAQCTLIYGVIKSPKGQLKRNQIQPV